MAFKSQKYELVELVLPAAPTASGRYGFPDLPKLRYTSLQAVETFTVNDITISPLGNALLPIAAFQKCYLTLYINERQDAYRIPLASLHRTQNSNTDPFVRSLFEFNGQKVTWDKSYIEFGSTPTLSTTVSLSVLFGVYYS
jgi:hypothetical protein